MPKPNGLARKTTHFKQIPLKVVEKIANVDAPPKSSPRGANDTVEPARPAKE